LNKRLIIKNDRSCL